MEQTPAEGVAAANFSAFKARCGRRWVWCGHSVSTTHPMLVTRIVYYDVLVLFITRMHACTHARTHARTHAHTHTHTHTEIQMDRQKQRERESFLDLESLRPGQYVCEVSLAFSAGHLRLLHGQPGTTTACWGRQLECKRAHWSLSRTVRWSVSPPNYSLLISSTVHL